MMASPLTCSFDVATFCISSVLSGTGARLVVLLPVTCTHTRQSAFCLQQRRTDASCDNTRACVCGWLHAMQAALQ